MLFLPSAYLSGLSHQYLPVIRCQRGHVDRFGLDRVVYDGYFHLRSALTAGGHTIVPSAQPRLSATSGSTSTVSASPPPILASELAAASPDHPR